MKHPKNIPITEFTYDLPEEKIALYPAKERDSSKLLVYKNGEIEASMFTQIDSFLEQGSLLVFNDTRVINARLNFFNSKQQAIEIFCLEPASDQTGLAMAMQQQATAKWNCLVGNLKRWKEKELKLVNKQVELTVSILEKKEQYVEVAFSWLPASFSFAEMLEATGNIPIPPYLKRSSDVTDQERYQTVYAREKGSVAAPTAGLHFTERVLKKLKDRSVKTLTVTLHVGAGTFKPVKSATMAGHDMHAEWMDVDITTLESLVEQTGRPIIPVGTTSLRTIETLYWMGVKASQQPEATLYDLEIKQWDVYEMNGSNITVQDSLQALLVWMRVQRMNRLLCQTQILIAPPYRLKIASGIITNFHQPQSTLLLLISAITGDRWREIYEFALSHDFKFLSYGDSSLLLK